MSKSLVIVESPSKAKTINKYLGKDFKVLASVGHVKDLPKKGLGVDVDNNFEPTYEVMPGKEKVVREIKEAAKDAETVYIATDPDREGEAIGYHLAEIVKSGRGNTKKPIFRVMFHEITKNAVQAAFKTPGQIDNNLVDAQQARRVLDRIVGYKVSPLLWDKVRRGLSAGRVQTVAVRLVVEREREIQAFIKTEYWSVIANLAAQLPPQFDARLYKVADQTVKTSGFDDGVRKTEFHITDEGVAQKILDELKGATYTVAEVSTKEKKRNPVPPFITSKLQQEASRKLRFSAKRTMQIAQKLYEGKEIGSEGLVGLITYMRTDSVRVSDTAVGEVRDFITGHYGPNYLPEKAIQYRGKKDAQDAHEAIRPTSADRTPDAMAKYLDKDELALYRLIWQRFVASQMMPAIFDQTTIDIAAGEKDKYTFRATGSVIKFDGFLAVYEEGKDEKDDDDDERAAKLPKVEKGEQLKLNSLTPNQHFTEPPPRYTEATLVKMLEEKGIGRPSTYASIMSVIQDREYVEKKENKFYPTDLGTLVNDLLIESFADLFNVEYTARMEGELDEVEEGKLKWTQALRTFYDKFTGDLKTAQAHMRDVKRQEIITDEECDKCGSKMAIKFGRFGQFLACTNYPECKSTREIAKPMSVTGESGEATGEAVENPYADEKCINCDRPMVLKKGRFGSFLACTGYPDCKTTRKITKTGAVAAAPQPIDEFCPDCGTQLAIKQGPYGEYTGCQSCKYIKRETTGVPCPREGCKGEIVVKKSKRGKVFYGCGEYPKCDVVFWDKPVLTACPQCAKSFTLEKYNAKKEETTRYCSDAEGCGYREGADGGVIAAKATTKAASKTAGKTAGAKAAGAGAKAASKAKKTTKAATE